MKRFIYIALVVSVIVAGMAFSQDDSTKTVSPEKILTVSAKEDGQVNVDELLEVFLDKTKKSLNHEFKLELEKFAHDIKSLEADILAT